jgi:hypothetical protein
MRSTKRPSQRPSQRLSRQPQHNLALLSKHKSFSVRIAASSNLVLLALHYSSFAVLAVAILAQGCGS